MPPKTKKAKKAEAKSANWPNLEPSDEEVEAWKKKRTRCRSQVTQLCKEIQDIITQKGSRTSLSTFLEQAKKILSTSQDLHEKLSDEIVNEAEAQAQFSKQLTYVKKVADTEEMVNNYFVERKNDAASVVASHTHTLAASVKGSQALNQHLEADEVDDDSAQAGVRKWREESRQARRLAAPDDWIDEYRAGRLQPPPEKSDCGRKSTVKTTLSIYSGLSLEWFSWIDLFKSLVHESSNSPGEKLSILKRHLTSECQDIVYSFYLKTYSQDVFIKYLPSR